uniref:Uncharacterized protein n=1 Tax=Oryza brachyantha TaxID=4533 RepID=J3KZQ7_ORYBR
MKRSIKSYPKLFLGQFSLFRLHVLSSEAQQKKELSVVACSIKLFVWIGKISSAAKAVLSELEVCKSCCYAETIEQDYSCNLKFR